VLRAFWDAVKDVVAPDPGDARFVLRQHVNAMGGDRTISIVDQAYRVRVGGVDAQGTLAADELDAFVRDLDAHEVFSLDAASDSAPQPSCQPWTTVTVRAGERRHRVRYYGAPNARVARFQRYLSTSIVMRRAHKLEVGETFDPTLMCTGCSGQHATGSTTCRHDGNGLVRVDGALFRCASCKAKLPLMLHYVTACSACGVAMPARK
jgi:hypothetical protein